MAALLKQLFCCCCGRPHLDENEEEPNEHTHLIRPPTENGAVLTAPNYTVDHQKLKDRLGTIVRAKEGRMVNVNTPLPFNVHNKDVNGRRLDMSSSRSARSRSAHATMGGPAGYGPEMLPDVPSRMASYSPTREREPSPPLDINQSTTSLHPGDASYLPEADDENGGRRPVLNVKLVKGANALGVGGESASRPRQGRSITRGRPGLTDAIAAPDGAQGINGSAHVDDSQADNAHLTTEPDSEPGTASTPQAADFKIESVGNITCSWGD